MTTNTFIFDFDSTLVSIESFDEILKIALGENTGAKQKQIEKITNAGMNGEIDLSESLTQRLQVAAITKEHLEKFEHDVVNTVTRGIPIVIDYLLQNEQKVFVLSGGFTEIIIPVALRLGIEPKNCLANTFVKNARGDVTGIDFANPLSKSTGKTEVINHKKQSGKMPGKVICIGDGISDANPYVNGVANEFWGFFANVNRPKVREVAVKSFDSSAELMEELQGFDFKR
jgi:D-3-phosphoglycerate dehydrogenase